MATVKKLKKDPRVDEYIKSSPPFAEIIFIQLRKLIHDTCPQSEETVKWGSPWFTYEGKAMCGLVTFKAHCAFLFNKGSQILDDDGEQAWDGLGKLRRLTDKKDLPSSRTLKSYLKQAMKLNEPGAPKAKRPARKVKPPVQTPATLMTALKASPKALAVYKAFSPSHQRHYAEWIADAKTEATRETRLQKAIKCIAAGKTRHWE